MFEEGPLGRYNYLTEAQGRKEVEGSFLVGGFFLPLQILAYECYLSVAQRFARRRDVDGLMLPRMFQWVTRTWPSNRAPTGVDITAAFGDCPIDNCLGFLTPTPEELVSPYYTTRLFVDSAPNAVITQVLELWRQGQTVICSEHPLESPSVQHTPSAYSTPDVSGTVRSVQHTPLAHESPDVSGTRSGDLNRSSSSTSSPMRTGPRVHFGLNLSRNPSPLEHRFERRLTALEDSIMSMHIKLSSESIETRACIRNINMALDDMKASFNLRLDEMRSKLTKQIRAGFAEMRSNMPVLLDKDYSVAYSRGRKRKSSEADFGVDENLAREIGQTQQLFEPNLPVITEESSEDMQVTPDTRKSGGEATTSRGVDENLATEQIFEPNLPRIIEESSEDIQVTRMSGGDATTSRDDGVRPLAETVTLKVNKSLARVRASMLKHSSSRIRGFYAEYEKSLYGSMAIANSRVTISQIDEALRELLEMQIRHPEVMSPEVSLMDRHFYTAISILAEDKDNIFKITLAGNVSKVKGSDPEWPCLSWEKARRILIPVDRDGRWFLLKLVTGVNKYIIYDLLRRHDPKLKDLNEEIELILINTARLLSIVGNNPHPERPWNIKLHEEFRAKILHEDSGAFLLAVVGYSL
ncbi:uncharacterized protein LOC142504332 [Primulina tabacum]|uniref:uncharacterized protein LOC142504332 n=1 Tax=Primulina tabacum TaxID=48773 RepID=UPI003F59200B